MLLIIIIINIIIKYNFINIIINVIRFLIIIKYYNMNLNCHYNFY
jgi:hypothetical protein